MSEKRLMKTPEEVRQKARELLLMPKEEVLTKYMFQEQEIERLTAESTKWESKFYDEAKKVDKAIEYLESYNTDFKNCRFGEAPISLRELGDLLDILKGVDKE